jgi:hypothetical protein
MPHLVVISHYMQPSVSRAISASLRYALARNLSLVDVPFRETAFSPPFGRSEGQQDWKASKTNGRQAEQALTLPRLTAPMRKALQAPSTKYYQPTANG